MRNSAYGADKFGFKNPAAVYWNLTEPLLYEHAIAAGEAATFAWLRSYHRAITAPPREVSLRVLDGGR